MRWLAMLILLAVLGGCAHPAAPPADRVGPFDVTVKNQPAPPRTGENALLVEVRDAAGKPVRGATVTVVVSMPAMGAMPYMESRGRVSETAPGKYRVAYGLSMAGDWDVTLRIAARGEEAEGRWRLSTRLPEVAFAAGAAEADTTGAFVLDAARRQAIGVRTATVVRRPFALPIRARGTVVYDETARAVVSMRYTGWVRSLNADFVGKPVARGQVLFTVDSPEMTAAQEEFVSALKFATADSSAHRLAFGDAGTSSSLADAARQRLLAFGLTPGQVAQVERTRRAIAPLPVTAPAGGVVVDKSIVPGAPFQAGQVLLSIARVDPVWVEAKLYEADLPYVRTGLTARVTAPFLEGAARAGRVAFVAPELDPSSRTGSARVTLANPGGALRPGMFVDVEIAADLGPRLTVPDGAVVPTGTRQLVFVDRGGGRLEPREVVIGPRAGGFVAIDRGLREGETVVASGNFLVAADARLRAALARW